MIPHSLRFFPWFTYGRREESALFFKKCREQEERSRLLKTTPRFSLILPITGAVRPEMFQRAFDALLAQAYGNWECLVVGDASKHPSLIAKIPPRENIRWIDCASIDEAALCNAGAHASTGDWVGVLDSESVLSPAALFQLTLEIQSHMAQILYTNEVWVSACGRKISRTLTKADPSTFNLLHFNPIGRFWVMRKDLFLAWGGFDVDAQPFHEHALFLRANREQAAFQLVPSFLYYRSELSQDAADRVRPGLSRVVQSHLDQIHFDGFATERSGLPSVRVRPRIHPTREDKISAIICFRNRSEDTVRAVRALDKRIGRIPLEVLLVDNGSDSAEGLAVQVGVRELSVPHRILKFDAPFNFARMHNEVIREHATGNFLFFLNNDVFWEQEGTLDTLVSWAHRAEIGTVGITLRYPNGKLQHGGLNVLFGGESRLVRVGNQQKEDAFTREAREVFANSFAACMVRRALFDEMGGLRELDLANGFGDLSFNLDCIKRGFHNINLGYIEAIHAESASRGAPYEFWEETIVEQEYPELLQRMLRRDLGFDRNTAAPMRRVLAEALGRELSSRFPRLGQLKSGIKEGLRAISRRRHSGTSR